LVIAEGAAEQGGGNDRHPLGAATRHPGYGLAKFLPAWETRRAGLRAQKAEVDAARTPEERAKASADLKAAFNTDPTCTALTY
jgi:hypothetical protein